MFSFQQQQLMKSTTANNDNMNQQLSLKTKHQQFIYLLVSALILKNPILVCIATVSCPYLLVTALFNCFFGAKIN
jgi:hypothetical protein